MHKISKFNAKLPIQVEYTPTESKATGIAEVTQSGESLSYNVNAANIQGGTVCKIHHPKRGANCEAVVTYPIDCAQ